MHRYPNPEQVHCFLCAGLYLTKHHKCDIHGCGLKKSKPCSYMIAQYCNCDEKHFASASACLKLQRAIETVKTGNAEWRVGERVAQEAQIAIEAEEDVESIIDEAATMAEGIDSPAGVDSATMKLTADEKKDIVELIDGTISEHWADASIDFT